MGTEDSITPLQERHSSPAPNDMERNYLTQSPRSQSPVSLPVNPTIANFEFEVVHAIECSR